jgi:P2-related tail formation protein
MEIRVTEEDLRNLVRSQAIQLADRDATIVALRRTITELEMSQAAQKEPKAKTK